MEQMGNKHQRAHIARLRVCSKLIRERTALQFFPEVVRVNKTMIGVVVLRDTLTLPSLSAKACRGLCVRCRHVFYRRKIERL